MILLKFLLLGIYIWDRNAPASAIAHFIGNIILVIWFSTCIHIAQTRYLPAHGQVLPIINAIGGHHHGHHTGMVMTQPVYVQQPMYVQPQVQYYGQPQQVAYGQPIYPQNTVY